MTKEFKLFEESLKDDPDHQHIVDIWAWTKNGCIGFCQCGLRMVEPFLGPLEEDND